MRNNTDSDSNKLPNPMCSVAKKILKLYPGTFDLEKYLDNMFHDMILLNEGMKATLISDNQEAYRVIQELIRSVYESKAYL